MNKAIDELRVRGEVPTKFVNIMPYNRKEIIENLLKISKENSSPQTKLLIQRILKCYPKLDDKQNKKISQK